MYEGIKTANLTSINREVITDKSKQMVRWVQLFMELHSKEHMVVTSALDTIEPLPTIEKLDTEPTVELSKSIGNLSCGKAPGSGSILPDLIKHCKNTLLQPYTMSFVNVGQKEQYHNTSEVPRSSPFTSITSTEVTATITVVSSF